MDLITHSRMKTARSCLREELIRYVQCIRPLTEAETLHLGTLIHRALEEWWRNLRAQNRRSLALAALDVESDLYIRAKAAAMVVGYDARWGEDALRYEVLGVEQEFSCPLVNPDTGAKSQTFGLGGKLDVLLRETSTGEVKLVEHKTSSEDIGVGGTYWKRLRMDSQVSTYFEGCKALGYPDVTRCLWDVLGVPGLRPLKATPMESRKYTKDGRLYAAQREFDESPEEYGARLIEKISTSPDEFYQREELIRLETDLVDAGRDRWQMAQQLRDGHRLGRAPRNPDACLRYSRACDYFDVCCGTASLDDTTKFRRAQSAHPELNGGGA